MAQYYILMNADLHGPAVVQGFVQWPGGKGRIVGQGINGGSGTYGPTSKIRVLAVSGDSGSWDLASAGIVPEVTADGVSDQFELPPCLMQFGVDLASGFDFQGSAYIVKMD